MSRLFASLALVGLFTSVPSTEMRQPMTLKAAYDAGLIRIRVEIAPQDKRGDRLQLQITSTDKPLTITLSTETVSLLMESPFDKLEFRAAAAQKLDLTAERPATLTVNQVGEYRFVAGKFQTLFYEGKPSFIGSATKDVVK
jgi:hypothetical protein